MLWTLFVIFAVAALLRATYASGARRPAAAPVRRRDQTGRHRAGARRDPRWRVNAETYRRAQHAYAHWLPPVRSAA